MMGSTGGELFWHHRKDKNLLSPNSQQCWLQWWWNWIIDFDVAVVNVIGGKGCSLRNKYKKGIKNLQKDEDFR